MSPSEIALLSFATSSSRLDCTVLIDSPSSFLAALIAPLSSSSVAYVSPRLSIVVLIVPIDVLISFIFFVTSAGSAFSAINSLRALTSSSRLSCTVLIDSPRVSLAASIASVSSLSVAYLSPRFSIVMLIPLIESLITPIVSLIVTESALSAINALRSLTALSRFFCT